MMWSEWVCTVNLHLTWGTNLLLPIWILDEHNRSILLESCCNIHVPPEWCFPYCPSEMRLDHSVDLGYYSSSSEDCRMSARQQQRRQAHSSSRASTLNTSGSGYNNFASLAHTALHASSQSLDHYPINHYPATPPSYPRSPVHHQRYNQYAGHQHPPAAPSPPPNSGYYSPKRSGAANFYWTARVGLRSSIQPNDSLVMMDCWKV